MFKSNPTNPKSTHVSKNELPCTTVREKKFHVYAHLQASITNAVNNLCEFLSILKLFNEHRISN